MRLERPPGRVPPAVRNLFVARVFSVETLRRRVTPGRRRQPLPGNQQNVLDRIRIVSTRSHGRSAASWPTDARRVSRSLWPTRVAPHARDGGGRRSPGDAAARPRSTDPLSVPTTTGPPPSSSDLRGPDLADPYWSADTTGPADAASPWRGQRLRQRIAAGAGLPWLMAATDEGGPGCATHGATRLIRPSCSGSCRRPAGGPAPARACSRSRLRVRERQRNHPANGLLRPSKPSRPLAVGPGGPRRP
jgi:hypothetical protein